MVFIAVFTKLSQAYDMNSAEHQTTSPNVDGDSCCNCGTVLQGKYCHLCGQRKRHLRPKLQEFLGVLWEDLVAVDARLLRSLKGLFLPGKLTTEWLAGRQQQHLNPGRLFGFVVLVFALYFTFFMGPDKQESLQKLVEGLSAKASSEVSKELREYYTQQATTLLALFGIPLLAFWAFIFRKTSTYYANCVFVLHILSALLAAFLLLLIVTRPMKWMLPDDSFHQLADYLLWGGFVWYLGYLALSAKRVFQISAWGAMFKTAGYLFCTMLSVMLLVLAYFKFRAFYP